MNVPFAEIEMSTFADIETLVPKERPRTALCAARFPVKRFDIISEHSTKAAAYTSRGFQGRAGEEDNGAIEEEDSEDETTVWFARRYGYLG